MSSHGLIPITGSEEGRTAGMFRPAPRAALARFDNVSDARERTRELVAGLNPCIRTMYDDESGHLASLERMWASCLITGRARVWEGTLIAKHLVAERTPAGEAGGVNGDCDGTVGTLTGFSQASNTLDQAPIPISSPSSSSPVNIRSSFSASLLASSSVSETLISSSPMSPPAGRMGVSGGVKSSPTACITEMRIFSISGPRTCWRRLADVDLLAVGMAGVESEESMKSIYCSVIGGVEEGLL